jgi:hypothetical protein
MRIVNLNFDVDLGGKPSLAAVAWFHGLKVLVQLTAYFGSRSLALSMPLAGTCREPAIGTLDSAVVQRAELQRLARLARALQNKGSKPGTQPALKGLTGLLQAYQLKGANCNHGHGVLSSKA